MFKKNSLLLISLFFTSTVFATTPNLLCDFELHIKHYNSKGKVTQDYVSNMCKNLILRANDNEEPYTAGCSFNSFDDDAGYSVDLTRIVKSSSDSAYLTLKTKPTKDFKLVDLTLNVSDHLKESNKLVVDIKTLGHVFEQTKKEKKIIEGLYIECSVQEDKAQVDKVVDDSTRSSGKETKSPKKSVEIRESSASVK